MNTLPKSTVVPNFIPEATNQGERGTCAAFSTIALLEYYLQNKVKLSPQFLYACCKLSEAPEDAETAGASIEEVFNCVQQFGVLPMEQWPYNPNQTADEAQISVERIDEFQTVSLPEIKFHKLYTPSNIDEYKYILAGANNNKPMPIVFGCRVYSPMNIHDDWLEVPFGAVPDGGHAMLIYGYKDAEHIPGGGYFLVQNSWGKNWAKNNSGLIKISYQYVIDNAWEAGTIMTSSDDKNSSHNTSPMQKYISVATQAMRDALSGVIVIAAGDSIITDDRGNARLNTPKNWNQFVSNGYSFWQKLSPELAIEIDRNMNDARQFGSALDVNIRENTGKIIPGINLPVWVNLIPHFFSLKFREYKEIPVDGEEFCNFLSRAGIIPEKDTVTKEDFAKIKAANLFRMYELSRGSIVFRFVAFFVTPIDIQQQKIIRADNSIYEALRSFVKTWEKNNGAAKPNCACWILATPEGWGNNDPVALKDSVQLLCHLNESRQWIVRHLALDNYRKVYRDFVYSLYPEKSDERCARVKKYIEGYNRYGGNITVKKISKELNIPEELVASCCDKLQKTGNFLNYFANSEKAVRVRSAEEKNAKLIRFSQPDSWFKRHVKGFGVALIGILGIQLRGVLLPPSLQQEMGKGLSVFMLAVCLYITTCIQGYFERKLDK